MTTGKSWTAPIAAAVAAAVTVVAAGCTRTAEALSPQQLQQQYGIGNAYSGQISTPDGPIRGTFVPVRMPDGHQGELIVAPAGPAYFRDEAGVHAIGLQPNVTREQMAAGPTVVERRAPHTHARPWQKSC